MKQHKSVHIWVRSTVFDVLAKLAQYGTLFCIHASFLLRMLIGDIRATMLKHQIIDLVLDMLKCNDDIMRCTVIRVLEMLAQYGVLLFDSVLLLLTALSDDTRETIRRSHVISELTNIRASNHSWLAKKADSVLGNLK